MAAYEWWTDCARVRRYTSRATHTPTSIDWYNTQRRIWENKHTTTHFHTPVEESTASHADDGQCSDHCASDSAAVAATATI